MECLYKKLLMIHLMLKINLYQRQQLTATLKNKERKKKKGEEKSKSTEKQ